MTYRNQKNALRSLTSLALTQGGYFTAKQAEQAGYSYPHLIYHLKAGNFERAGHGLYRIQSLPLSEHDDLVRLSLWSRGRDDQPQAVVSHQTALGLYDLGELIPVEIHVTVPRSFRKRASKGCRLHKGTVTDKETRAMSGFRVTSPSRTLADLASDPSMPSEQFDKAMNTAIKRGLIRRSQAKAITKSRKTNGRSRAKGASH